MWNWLRRKSSVVQIGRGSALGIYLVPGVFRVEGITYDTDGNATITLLKEDRFFRKYGPDYY